MSSVITLRNLNYEEYSNLRDFRFSKDSLQFDDPDRPLPSIEQEKIWWENDVNTKNHIIRAIEIDNELCGVVNAFSFDRIDNSCEIGIEIYPSNNFNKGIGKKSVALFIEYLKNMEGIVIIKAETNIKNIAANKIFDYLQFIKTDIKIEDNMEWQCFEKEL